MNVEKLRSLLGNDDKLVHKFLEMYKTELPKQLDLLLEAMDQSDWENISIIAHGIKSQAKYLDLIEIASVASDLEICADEKDDLDSIPIYLFDLSKMLQEVIETI